MGSSLLLFVFLYLHLQNASFKFKTLMLYFCWREWLSSVSLLQFSLWDLPIGMVNWFVTSIWFILFHTPLTIHLPLLVFVYLQILSSKFWWTNRRFCDKVLCDEILWKDWRMRISFPYVLRNIYLPTDS